MELKCVCLKFVAVDPAAVVLPKGFEHLRDYCPLHSVLLVIDVGTDDDRDRYIWGQLLDSMMVARYDCQVNGNSSHPLV
eukprot:c26522_g2_i1 orf=230-466(-)